MQFFKGHKFRTLFAIVLVLAVFIGIGSAIDHGKAANAPRPTGNTSTPLPVVQPSQPSAPTPPPAPSTPAPPAMTASQQQAVQAAQGYLSDGAGFSAESLDQQLTSSAGNGFSQADAQFAINYLNPNWDAQALDAAQGYMSDGEGFSASSLTQQLTSTYGNGFTNAQATYAVNKVMP